MTRGRRVGGLFVLVVAILMSAGCGGSPALPTPSPRTTAPPPASTAGRSATEQLEECISVAQQGSSPERVQHELERCQVQFQATIDAADTHESAIAALQACIADAQQASRPAEVQRRVQVCQDAFSSAVTRSPGS